MQFVLSIGLVAQGKAALDPYSFDYLLLCNKICGASHYNMQMKIIVDTPEDYKIWLKEQKNFEQVKAANAPADEDGSPVGDSLKAKDTCLLLKWDEVIIKNI
jgi:cytochrome c oxidase subunit 2